MPIQPRSDLCPDLECAFQVTNIGYDSVTDKREAYVEPELVADESLVSCVLDELTDVLDGVDSDEPEEWFRVPSRNRDIKGS